MSCENNRGKLYNYCLNVRKDQFKLGQVPSTLACHLEQYLMTQWKTIYLLSFTPSQFPKQLKSNQGH